MAEYALLVALIAVAVIGTLQVLAGSITAVFTATSTEMGALATP